MSREYTRLAAPLYKLHSPATLLWLLSHSAKFESAPHCQPGLCCWCSSNKSLHSLLHHEFAKCIRKMDQNGEWVDDLNQIRRKAKERNKQIVCLPSHWVAFMRCIIWDICANGIRILQCWDYGVIGFDRWIIPDRMTRWDRHSLLWHALTTCLSKKTTTFNICEICTKKPKKTWYLRKRNRAKAKVEGGSPVKFEGRNELRIGKIGKDFLTWGRDPVRQCLRYESRLQMKVPTAHSSPHHFDASSMSMLRRRAWQPCPAAG